MECDKLPTLHNLVSSDKVINPQEIYYVRETYSDDNYRGYSGNIILRMREIGIDKYREEREKKFWDLIMRVYKGETKLSLTINQK